jgi:hypothetical protein
VPPVENCANGVDDDCDGLVDSMDTSCAGACPGSVAITTPGGRYTAPLVPHVHTGSCGGAGSEAYFNFTLAAASDVFLTTHASQPIDTVLYVRPTNCGGSESACNADADGLTTSTLRLTNLAAGTYQVFVDTAVAMSAMITLDAYIATPGPLSDRCGNPQFIAAGSTTLAAATCTGIAADYTASTTCFGRGAAADRVYYFYLPTARAVTFSSCGSGTNYDTVAYLRNVCSDGTPAQEPACNDDGCGGSSTLCSSPFWRSTMTATIGPGLFYFFADGYDAPPSTCGCGNFSYAITGL